MDQSKSKRVASIDGLKCIAIILVVFYHLLPYRVPGGFLGVDLFFIISSCLLTISLKRSLMNGGHIGLMTLIKRRAKRLFQPLMWMILLVIAFMFWFQPDLLNDSRASIVSSLTFTNNWWQIVNGDSYFQQALSPNVFSHLWFISILFQFTLAWTIIFTLLAHLFDREAVILRIIVVMIVASFIAMYTLYHPGEDPTRVYYGTDTRAYSYLLGSFLALVWPINRLNKTISNRQSLFLDFCGLCFSLSMLWFVLTLQDNQPFTYKGGIFLSALSATGLFAVSVNPNTLWNRLLSLKPIVSIGKRSYSYYIWYYPIITLYQYKLTNHTDYSTLHILIQVLLIALLGELSYRVFEKKHLFSIFGFGFFKKVVTLTRSTVRNPLKYIPDWIALMVVLVVPVSAVLGFLNAPEGRNRLASEIEKSVSERYQTVNKDPRQTTVINRIDGLNQEETNFTSGLAISFFGDSTLLASANHLQKIFPKATFDAERGRQLYQVLPDIEKYVSTGDAQDTVVLMLGTNGTFSDDQLNAVMDALGDSRQIFLVNTYVPKPWQNDVNRKLEKTANERSNVHLIDWNKAAIAHPDWLYEDHIHPNEEGSKEFGILVAKQITQVLSD
ncbi:MAG: acyltransferase family protein [Bavariicoccus seileri]|uniref:acyltransferase family protein n=1 Tax=Bavariicoccus seileri TaxID=549685 RepID=UPI003F96C150